MRGSARRIVVGFALLGSFVMFAAPARAAVKAGVPISTTSSTTVEPLAVHANDDTAITDENVAVAIDVLANDTSPFLTISFAASPVGQPAHGTVVNSAGKLLYTPAAGFSGTDKFTYQAAAFVIPDSQGTTPIQLSAQADVTVTVRAVEATTIHIDPDTSTTVTAVLHGGVESTSSTAAVAATAASGTELPRTGGTSAPLTVTALVLVALGAIAGLVRRRAR